MNSAGLCTVITLQPLRKKAREIKEKKAREIKEVAECFLTNPSPANAPTAALYWNHKQSVRKDPS
jgi:hypothetical protein